MLAGRRQIPGTQKSREPIPTLEEEPKWMKLLTTSPAPAGAAMFRDHRAWYEPPRVPSPPRPHGWLCGRRHGGTPNLSWEVRAIPGAYYDAPWYNSIRSGTGLPGNALYAPWPSQL